LKKKTFWLNVFFLFLLILLGAIFYFGIEIVYKKGSTEFAELKSKSITLTWQSLTALGFTLITVLIYFVLRKKLKKGRKGIEATLNKN